MLGVQMACQHTLAEKSTHCRYRMKRLGVVVSQNVWQARPIDRQLRPVRLDADDGIT